LDEGTAAWGSTEFIVVRPNAGTPRAFPYLLARHQAFREFLIAAMSGTSGRQRVQADMAARWSLPIPNRPVLEAFADLTNPMFERITRAGEGSVTLTALRDTLLPKLTSGELRIRDAEHAIVAA
jgi:type I restriction enzyme S subunit